MLVFAYKTNVLCDACYDTNYLNSGNGLELHAGDTVKSMSSETKSGPKMDINF